MSDQQKLFTQQVDLLLDLLNQQRHDWLNHFQVLLGYLRLGKTLEGEAYLRQVTEAIQQESRIARLNCPRLSVFFLTFNVLQQDLRLQVNADCQLDLSRLTIEREQF
jgi:stage 0 sporulation protein B (sporulation initiation phosphotransferase)